MRRGTRRTTTLAAATMMGLALMAPATGASAATEMCQGRPATIVGTPDGQIVGTPGDDVIVSYGDFTVDAGDGDDLICLRPILSLVQEVDAGPGDDSVVSEGETNNAFTDLGPGRDSFVGGGGEDRIEASFDGTAGKVSLAGEVVTTFAVSPRMLFGVAQHVTLVGTPGFDRLGTAACGTSVIRGRGANDQIVALGDRATPRRECRNRRMLAIGGGGNDSIQGTKSADVLRGGSGNDRIFGSGGNER